MYVPTQPAAETPDSILFYFLEKKLEHFQHLSHFLHWLLFMNTSITSLFGQFSFLFQQTLVYNFWVIQSFKKPT